MKFAPPKSLPAGATPSAENMKDDETGEALMQRPDDTAEALVNRLQVRIPPQPACPRSSRLGLLGFALRVLWIALALRPRLLMPAAVLWTQPACLPAVASLGPALRVLRIRSSAHPVLIPRGCVDARRATTRRRCRFWSTTARPGSPAPPTPTRAWTRSGLRSRRDSPTKPVDPWLAPFLHTF